MKYPNDNRNKTICGHRLKKLKLKMRQTSFIMYQKKGPFKREEGGMKTAWQQAKNSTGFYNFVSLKKS